jgi:hypothetical protein
MSGSNHSSRIVGIALNQNEPWRKSECVRFFEVFALRR